MSKDARRHGNDLRAASKLVVDATKAVTAVVEEMHRTIGSGPPLLGRPFAGPARAWTGLVYAPIRGVTHLVGAALDAALAQLAPLLGESIPGPEREAVVAVVNGVLGDYLEETKNPLATRMVFRQNGEALPLEAQALRERLPDARAKILLLVHGSSMTDRQWLRGGHDHGAALAGELGLTPVYLLYNSGLHISTNGRELAGLLDQLVRAWPVEVSEISILGHSMGGLVARSACHVAAAESLPWLSRVRNLVTLGTPHHASPLERSGNWLDALLGISSYSAPLRRLTRLRSAGVTDMRFGHFLDEHWEGADRFAHVADSRRDLTLPPGVACYAIAATTATALSDKLPGDGLVPVA